MGVQANRIRLWMLIGCLASMGMGCTHIISDSLRQQAQPPVSFAELRMNPQAFKGRTVIVGGEILQTTNLRDATRIEVLQRSLSNSEMPKLTETTGGRFMLLCTGYLDPAVYAPQRRLTVAGQVLGTYDGKVGEADYMYPLISCEEIHVFPPAAAQLLWHTVNPWWFGGPYYYPWTVGAYPYVIWRPYWRYW